MYSGWSHPDTTRIYPQYEHPSTYTKEQPQNYGHSRTVTQLPRPLEPRPSLQSSLSEPSLLCRPQAPYHYREGPSPDGRPQNQNLPGLKDILNPDPFSPTQKSYRSSWSPSGPPPSTCYDQESRYSMRDIHPPLVLHPPTVANLGYQPQLEKAYERSNLDSNRQSQAPPLSPHVGYPDASRDNQDIHPERPKHASTGSILSNGVPSPYRAALPEEAHNGTASATPYRQGRTNHAAGGAESHGKYLGVDEVTGEGKFHVYEDGFRIPTQVDGEQVNPAWGLTKAMKPRKRLALACLDCREKKIKCEPGASNSCIQCEKALRPCRKAPEKFTQPDTASNYFVGSPIRKSAADPDIPSRRLNDSDPLSKRRARADPSPPLESNKRQRSSSPPPDRVHGDDRHRGADISPRAGASTTAAGGREDALMWENDPYSVEPEVTLLLMDVYFSHVNNATYCMLPRRHFLQWLKTPQTKCQNEKMLLYAMLAAASLYAGDQWAGFGKQCAQIAGDAISSELGRSNIGLAQSKILLAVYHFAKGTMGAAYDLVGSAIRTVSQMDLNTEEGCKDNTVSESQPRYEFDYSEQQLAECKRRTFWSCFIQDRVCGAAVCTIKPEDIFIRLPCSDEMYEHSVPATAPFFRDDIYGPDTTQLSPTSRLSPMAWLVLAHAIWGDVTDFALRASHRPNTTYRSSYESFYNRTQTRAQDWLTSLPEELRFNVTNLDISIQHGYVGTFVSMHVLYHLSLIKLNRYMRHDVLPDAVSRNIRTANHHGHQILQIMTALHDAPRKISAPAEGQPDTFGFSTHFPGYAILAAIDIVSAGGLDSNLKATLDEIDGALGCLRELAKYWESAKDQLRACQKRFYQLKNITITPKTAKSGCWLGRRWGIKTPLEQEFSSQDDCIYGNYEEEADEAMVRYFDAFKEG